MSLTRYVMPDGGSPFAEGSERRFHSIEPGAVVDLDLLCAYTEGRAPIASVADYFAQNGCIKLTLEPVGAAVIEPVLHPAEERRYGYTGSFVTGRVRIVKAERLKERTA